MKNQFTLTINLGNDAMKNRADVAKALIAVAGKVKPYPTDSNKAVCDKVFDVNGNSVGEWEYNP